ncbi:MAG: hypothetical protein Q9192_006408 [Flavoplaca navasiana]
MMADSSNHASAASASLVCPSWCRLRTQQDREGDCGWLVVARPGGVRPLPVGDGDTGKLYLHFNGPESQYCYYTLDFSRDGQHHRIGVVFDEDQKHWVQFGIVQKVLDTLAVAFPMTDCYKNSIGSTSTLPSLTATGIAPNTSSSFSPTGDAAAAPSAAPDWPSRLEEFIGPDHGVVAGDQHRSCATNASNRIPPVKDATPKSVYGTNCYDAAHVHGLNFPSNSQETRLGKAGRIFGRSRSRHVDEDDWMVLDDHDDQDIQHVHQIQQGFADWCFQHGNNQDYNYVEFANRHSKTTAPKATADFTTNLGQSKKSQDGDIGHVVCNSHISQVVQGIQHVEDTQNVHGDQFLQHGSHQFDRYSATADHCSRIASQVAVAQSAMELLQSGSPVDEEESDGFPMGQPHRIQTDPKQRRTESSYKRSVVPEVGRPSLHSPVRKRVRSGLKEYTSVMDHPDKEDPLREHNTTEESMAQGNEGRAKQARGPKKRGESSQKSEAAYEPSQNNPHKIYRKDTTSSGPIMGTFKNPHYKSFGNKTKGQAKANKQGGNEENIPPSRTSTRRATLTPAASVQAQLRNSNSKKRRRSTEKNGWRKDQFKKENLVLSQNDEPKESLSRTQKAPKKSIPRSSKSTLTTPAVAHAWRTCGRIYANEAEALADETDEDPDLKDDEKDEKDDEEQPAQIKSSAENNALSGISCSVKNDQMSFMSVWKLM